MKDWFVEVGHRGWEMDPKVAVLYQDLAELGFKHIGMLRVASVYRITGDLNRNQIEDISARLLLDFITQWHVIRSGGSPTPTLFGPPSIEVWSKPGVTDMVGDSVCQAIKDLGYVQKVQVRTGQKYHITGRLTPAELEQITRELLANNLIQEHTVCHDDRTNNPKP